jgi:hypothetical protein
VLLFGIGTRALPSWDSKTRRNIQSAAQISIARGYDFIYLRLYPLGHEKLLPEIPQDEARFSRAVDQLMSFRGDLV